MREKVMLVVGDKFSQFAQGKDVMTISQLMVLLTMPAVVGLDRSRLVAMPGQGLGDDDVERVLAAAATSAHRDHFDLKAWRNRPKRANGKLSHKRRPENTLISAPRRLAMDLFEMEMLVDEDCELMADHQTGQHVQGMVLMEAARQAFLAVTEAFYLNDSDKKFYFVINELSARYVRFAFPLDAQIRYRVTKADTAKASRQSFEATIEIIQCGEKAASFTTSFTVYEDERVSAREAELAHETLANHVSSLSSVEELVAIAA